MKVDSLKIYLENIRNISSYTGEFYPGINLIIGSNGSGKTTLVSSLYLALFGRTLSGTSRHSRIVTQGQSTGFVSISINDSINIERSFGKSSFFKVTIDSKEVPNGTQIIDKELIKLIYVLDPKIDVMKFFDVEGFVEKSRKTLKSFFNEVYQLELKLKEIQIKSSVLKEELSRIEKDENTIREKLILRIEDKQKSQEQIKGIDEATLVSLIDKYKQLEFQISFEISKRQTANKESFLRQISDWQLLVNNITSAKNNVLEGLSSLDRDLKKEISLAKSDLNAQYLKELSSNQEIEEISSELSATSHMLQKYQSLLLSTVEGKCPVCGNTISEDHIREQIELLIAKQQELSTLVEAKKSSLKDKYKTIYLETENSLKESYQEKRKVLESKKAELDQEERRLYKAKPQQKVFSEDEEREIKNEVLKRSNIPDGFNLNDALKKLQIFEHIRVIETEIKYLQAELVKLEDRKQVINKEIDQIYDEMLRLETEVSKKKTIEPVLEKLTDTREIRRHIQKKISGIIKSFCDKINENLPVKIYPALTETTTGSIELSFSASNIHGDIIPIDDLSQGESVLAKISLNVVLRKFAELACNDKDSVFNTIPKIVVLDEQLDRLDDKNAEAILETLSREQDYVFLIVTHREDFMNVSDANVVFLG